MKNIILPCVVYTALQNINIFTLNLLSRNSLKTVYKYLCIAFQNSHPVFSCLLITFQNTSFCYSFG